MQRRRKGRRCGVYLRRRKDKVKAMNEQQDGISLKWIAKGVNGHTFETLDEYGYTSDMPPVEAAEYDRVFQLANELESKLDAVPIDAIKAIIGSVQVDNWTRKPLVVVNRWLAQAQP